jgi:hypothetical protein
LGKVWRGIFREGFVETCDGNFSISKVKSGGNSRMRSEQLLVKLFQGIHKLSGEIAQVDSFGKKLRMLLQLRILGAFEGFCGLRGIASVGFQC